MDLLQRIEKGCHDAKRERCSYLNDAHKITMVLGMSILVHAIVGEVRSETPDGTT